MPQLRDSSNDRASIYDLESSGYRDREAPKDMSSRETVSQSAYETSFDRIFGLETEYGVSATGVPHGKTMSEGESGSEESTAESSTEASAESLTVLPTELLAAPLTASTIAQVMFEPILSRARSTNTYAVNGSRLYLDVGAHPEYATAEARTVREAIVQDSAGEYMMRRLALYAQRQLTQRFGISADSGDLRVHVYKNNTDSRNNSFGCHENYLVRRSLDLVHLEQALIPFLVTRQIFAGSGVVRDGKFQISQRADFLDDAVSSATTRSRPMINTRDESHADSRLYRRLHVIVGDSNRSQRATWMKMMTTHLVLCALEDESRGCHDYSSRSHALADPCAEVRHVSADLEFKHAMLLADGRTLSAIDMQRAYWDMVSRFLSYHADDMAASASGESDISADMSADIDECMALWKSALDALEAGNISALSRWVDWAAKYDVMGSYARRHADQDLQNAKSAAGISSLTAIIEAASPAVRARIVQIDLAYHDIVHDGVFTSLSVRMNQAVMFAQREILDATTQAPRGTRAELRSRFIASALDKGIRWNADWTSVSAVLGEGRTLQVGMVDPFDDSESEEYRALMDAMDNYKAASEKFPLV